MIFTARLRTRISSSIYRSTSLHEILSSLLISMRIVFNIYLTEMQGDEIARRIRERRPEANWHRVIDSYSSLMSSLYSRGYSSSKRAEAIDRIDVTVELALSRVLDIPIVPASKLALNQGPRLNGHTCLRLPVQLKHANYFPLVNPA